MTRDADPLDAFDEAIASFRQRVPMPEADWLRLQGEAREYGVKVAGVTHADVLTQVWLHIDDSLSRGGTYGEFAQVMEQSLTTEWAGTVANPAARIETIFRTNVQNAYSSGAWQQMQHPAIKRARPFVRSSTIKDQRQSDICEAIGTVILPADDPWWEFHWAPLHFNCRRRQVSLSEAQAKAQGITGKPPETQAADGFGRRPTGFPKQETQPSDYPSEVALALHEKEAAWGKTGPAGGWGDDTQLSAAPARRSA